MPQSENNSTENKVFRCLMHRIWQRLRRVSFSTYFCCLLVLFTCFNLFIKNGNSNNNIEDIQDVNYNVTLEYSDSLGKMQNGSGGLINAFNGEYNLIGGDYPPNGLRHTIKFHNIGETNVRFRFSLNDSTDNKAASTKSDQGFYIVHLLDYDNITDFFSELTENIYVNPIKDFMMFWNVPETDIDVSDWVTLDVGESVVYGICFDPLFKFTQGITFGEDGLVYKEVNYNINIEQLYD